MLYLTTTARLMVERYIEELKAKRKEILDAGKDTADETEIPNLEDIYSDVGFTGFDEDGAYFNNWAVTDNYDSDLPLVLTEKDFFEAEYTFTQAGLERVRTYLDNTRKKQETCIEKGLDTADKTPIPLPEEVLLEIQEEYNLGDGIYDFRQRIADDTYNPVFCTLKYGKDFIVSDNGRNFKTDKKRNAAYWDEIDATVERFINEIAVFSAKSFDFDGYDDGIIPDVRESVVEALKKCGAEFPYVNENM